MLILCRKKDQDIHIGDDVIVTVVRIDKGRVYIGIKAPKTVAVHRAEIFDIIQREKVADLGRCANSHCDEPAAAGGALCADCQHEADGITF